MDVYVGFGLLSAAVVVLLFIVFDTWFKSRQTRMAEMITSEESITEDSEFMSESESHDLAHFEIHENSMEDERHPIDIDHPTDEEHFMSDEKLSHLREDDDTVKMDSRLHGNDTANTSLRHPSEGGDPSKVNSQFHTQDKTNTAHYDKSPSYDNLLILSVMAKPNSRFASYDLLQAIATIGMQYGEMNIFHYYQQTMSGKVTLFSLASANKPGEFDLDNIGAFSCTGLVFFMNIARVPDPQNVFRLMLETAERLADYLDGELHADPSTPWNEKLVWQYQQKIMQYKTMARYETV